MSIKEDTPEADESQALSMKKLLNGKRNKRSPRVKATKIIENVLPQDKRAEGYLSCEKRAQAS